ncbi:MAG: hypothetical protein RLP44_20240 [Aggregatilineales bacterium]
MNRLSRLSPLIRWIALATILVAIILAFDLTEWIRGGMAGAGTMIAWTWCACYR